MEVAVLTRQLGTLLRAGVQLSESLAALIEQAEDPTSSMCCPTSRCR
jgi:type II secretory pathway component PulF